MKLFRFITFVLITVILLSACGSPAQPIQDATAVQPTQAPATAVPAGRLISNNGVEFTIPASLGTDASGTIVPEVVENSPAESPAYLEFSLQGYTPTREYFKPRIRVYSVQVFANYGWGQDTLTKLRAILANPLANPSLDAGSMPSAEKTSKILTAAGLKPISLAGMNGVRMLVVLGSGQIAGESATGDHVMYQFQGLTADGQYYVEALLPLAVTFLAQDSGSSVPADGVVLNMDQASYDQGVYDAYLKQVSDRLNAAEAANTISPSVSMLDALVQSLKVNSAVVMLPAPMPTAAEQPTEQPTIAAPVGCADGAELVSEDPLDNATFKPGDKITKRWTLKNTGTCTWTNYRFAFDGQAMGGNASTPVNQIEPGQTIDLFAYPVAPAAAGTYKGGATLYNASGGIVKVTYQGVQYNGVSIQIVVKGGAVGTITNATVSIVQEQGSGSPCNANATYFVNANITSDGPATATYQIYLTTDSGQVADGFFDGYGSPQAEGTLTFDAAGTLSVNLRVIGPYVASSGITVRINVNGQSWQSSTVSCQ